MRDDFIDSFASSCSVYMIGGINPGNPKQLNNGAKRTSGAIDIRRNGAATPGVTVLISGKGAQSGTSGFQHYVHGNITFPELRLDSWGTGDVGGDLTFDDAITTDADAGDVGGDLTSDDASWSTSMTISPNNRNFPAGDLTTTSANLPSDDLATIMTGIYGSAPGCLCTFPNSPSCPGMEGQEVYI
jgi:hypothetical protein